MINMKCSIRNITAIALVLLVTLAASLSTATPIHATTATPVYYSDGKTVIGYLNESNEIVYKLAANPYYNVNYLNYLLGDNVQKTVVFSSGMTIPLRYAIKPGSNKIIKATGATIQITTPGRGAIASIKPITNIKVYGGTWRNIADVAGCTNSMFRFAHSSNILVDGVDVQANVDGHSFEIIACKNVTVRDSKIVAVGSYVSTRYEEQVQIDIATPHTAPRIMEEFGTAYVQGQTCSYIYIINNYIKGARGVCASFAKADTQFINKFHRDKYIQDNTIVGMTGEGVSLFNTISATVTGNDIYSFNKLLSSSYSVGLSVTMFGNISATSISDKRIVIKSNLIKGGRQAVQVYSHSSSKFGRVYIKYNNMYCRNGASAALKATKYSIIYLAIEGNHSYKWL